MEMKKIYIIDYLNALEKDIISALSFPLHATDSDYIVKLLYYRNITISKDIVLLIQQRSFYNACILLSSLIENCLLIFYFFLHPEEATKYKEFASIEDLDRYRYWERKLNRINLSKEIKDKICNKYDIWTGVPQEIQLQILAFCKKNFKKYQKKGSKFENNEDFLCRENYQRYIIPKFNDIFDNIISYYSNSPDMQNTWITLKINYEEACQFKHMDPNKIITQFDYTSFICVPNEKISNMKFCFENLVLINKLLIPIVVPKYVLEQTYKAFENCIVTVEQNKDEP